MPTIEINGAQIYYQTFGDDRPGEAPILLIHGSTITGREDWSLVAPLLARHRKVIVPDCRGHGHSTNPNKSYSFIELAGDMAALVRALGYTKAHVIGHSNGGNVALVVLVEHPDVVQTAVVQAANAYVSPDLVEKEPSIFDSERVQREAPDWMEGMIRLHGETHGPEYWRDLLRMTVDEIIKEPNYTPADLAQVQRPTLVVQGENDRVNAPARHAQFIARHIPYAELWIPAGVGHSVHLEVLCDWVQKIEGFLDRRGSSAGEALHQLKADQFADEREGMFNISLALAKPGETAAFSLTGRVLTENQRRAAIQAVEASVRPATVDASGVQVLLTKSTPWAIINRAVTDLRREPRSLAELVSQGLLGEIVRILDESGTWSLIRMEQDGYIGWAHTLALHRCTMQDAQAYQAACRWKVVDELLPASLNPGESTDHLDRLMKLPFGVSVSVIQEQDHFACIRLPDGREAWVDRAGLVPTGKCPCPNPAGVAITLDLIKRFIGVPYMWGGRSPFGYDCSGLAGTFYAYLGVNIPRDADQQYREGIPVSGPAQPGDLLFFGEQDPDSPRFSAITHVGISLGGDEIIHANGTAWGTSYNSLNPDSPIFRAWLKENLVGIRRFA